MPPDYRVLIKTYYDHFAWSYDLGEFFRRGTRAAVVEASGCQQGDRVLEICSGTCELALTFASRGIHTVAVDLARKMLLLGKRKCSSPNLEFLETDALALPLADRSFDAVVISLALHHMPEHVQVLVLSEMARLARKKNHNFGVACSGRILPANPERSLDPSYGRFGTPSTLDEAGFSCHLPCCRSCY